MGGVPVKHHSKGKVGRRRSHLGLKKKKLLACESCGGPKMPHRTCAQCGFYGTPKMKAGVSAKAEQAQKTTPETKAEMNSQDSEEVDPEATEKSQDDDSSPELSENEDQEGKSDAGEGSSASEDKTEEGKE